MLELEAHVTLVPGVGDNEWLEVNVTRAARRWIWYPEANLGLYIQVLNGQGQ